MTTSNKHLAKARSLIRRGEDFYRKATEEILAAKADDPTLSNREIGRQIGRSDQWVSDLVRNANNIGTFKPYSGKYQGQKERMIAGALKDPGIIGAALGRADEVLLEAIIQELDDRS